MKNYQKELYELKKELQKRNETDYELFRKFQNMKSKQKRRIKKLIENKNFTLRECYLLNELGYNIQYNDGLASI